MSHLPKIEADREALRKVFYHLIGNAIKYTPDGGTITILGKALPDQVDLCEGGIEIVVSDTGIGIDPRFHDLIFRKFYQTGQIALHSTGKTKFKGGGPGLGLAIVQGIVEAHGGHVWVESPSWDEQVCPGSQFHVVLPLRQSKPSS
jgi:signal transduction histidine kinase